MVQPASNPDGFELDVCPRCQDSLTTTEVDTGRKLLALLRLLVFLNVFLVRIDAPGERIPQVDQQKGDPTQRDSKRQIWSDNRRPWNCDQCCRDSDGARHYRKPVKPSVAGEENITSDCVGNPEPHPLHLSCPREQ